MQKYKRSHCYNHKGSSSQKICFYQRENTIFPLVRKYVFTSGRNILHFMFKTVKVGLHHLVTILNECVNASVGGVMFQLVRILISTPGKIVSKIISYVQTSQNITNFGTASGSVSISWKPMFQLNKTCFSQLKYYSFLY